MAVRAEYRKLIKVAKSQGCESREELEDILYSPEFEDIIISGGEFECAVKHLKL